MNRSEKTLRAVYLEQLAVCLNAEAKGLRNDLEAEAEEEFRTEGTAPTWRIRDVGTVVATVSRETVVVEKPAALVGWVQDRHPTEVVMVPTIRAAWLAGLLERAMPAGEVACDPETGEVIPGLGVRPGGVFKGIQIRAEASAKEALRAVAAVKVKELVAHAEEPVVLAVAE
jgi:hypothetical protein